MTGIAQTVNVTAQNAATGAVKGHGPNIPCALSQHPFKAILQLIGSLVGKGDGDDAPGGCRFYGAEHICPVTVVIPHRLLQVLQKLKILIRHCIRDQVAVAAPAETDQIGHPVDQHCGLAAAGTGQQKQRSFCGHNGLQLHIIQPGKGGCNILAPGRNKSVVKIVAHSNTCLSLMLPFYRIFTKR